MSNLRKSIWYAAYVVIIVLAMAMTTGADAVWP